MIINLSYEFKIADEESIGNSYLINSDKTKTQSGETAMNPE
ncbi:hypothetical protein ACFPVY_06310 [Flavobacterium qiangtangense]|uniref:Uncharacterized protein n=1 Tax=Flavobacterium qiangtangense TaxID=1442595 RepID=A0ABW1PLF9_9FLAO